MQRLRSGEISRQELDVLKDRAFKVNEEVAEIPNDFLRGSFCQDPIDQTVHRGSSFDAEDNHYFTTPELEALKKNLYITVNDDLTMTLTEEAVEFHIKRDERLSEGASKAPATKSSKGMIKKRYSDDMRFKTY